MKINKIPKEKLQRYIFLGALILVFVAFFISLTLINQSEQPPNDDDQQNPNDDDDDPNPNDDDDDDIVKEFFEIPMEGDYVVVRKFYDVEASEEDQLLSIIQTGEHYQNSVGVSYALENGESFDVNSSLSGTVVNVEESPIFGFIVTIEHEDDCYTEYSSLSEATVEVGDEVEQGDVIGVSGECEFDRAAENHVHFKIIINDKNYNPETLIGQSLEDLE